MRLMDEIDQVVFASKQTELRDRIATFKLQIDSVDRSHDEIAELASKVFELSQNLAAKWFTASVPEKRQMLDIEFLNLQFVDVSLCATIRKPFDVLTEGLILKNSRGNKICT